MNFFSSAGIMENDTQCSISSGGKREKCNKDECRSLDTGTSLELIGKAIYSFIERIKCNLPVIRLNYLRRLETNQQREEESNHLPGRQVEAEALTACVPAKT